MLRGGVTPLMLAAATDQGRIVGMLLDRGADPNARDQVGRRPLMYAKRPEILRMLIRAGADVKGTDDHGWTALRQAGGWGHPGGKATEEAGGREEANSGERIRRTAGKGQRRMSAS
jgi:ankyrin repeat protein